MLFIVHILLLFKAIKNYFPKLFQERPEEGEGGWGFAKKNCDVPRTIEKKKIFTL